MIPTNFVSPDEIRARFSQAMSQMYRQEVPQYGTLLKLVDEVNAACLQSDPNLRQSMERHGELSRLDVERHGAIRLGTPQELATMRRIFGVMGMQPVGYYDLSVAGVPVHSTAFRPIGDEQLRKNPFRIFTSLLRLDLIPDQALRQEAQAILTKRTIFTQRALALVAHAEAEGGLDTVEADEFVQQVLETFRWHHEATVDAATYHRLQDAHRLVADVVCFKGPHINHLTPRTLDIDATQAEMLRSGLSAKAVVEGPPRRKHALLLRQTSFKALEEGVNFLGDQTGGTHTARFGEIEQRGIALTRAGRRLYDELLARVRGMDDAGNSGSDYADHLRAAFEDFPDDPATLRAQGLAFFHYTVRDEAAFAQAARRGQTWDLQALINQSIVEAVPSTYEDFLPVSAAGIFQSNLGGAEQKSYAAQASKTDFEVAMQCQVLDEIELYEEAQSASIAALKQRFQQVA